MDRSTLLTLFLLASVVPRTTARCPKQCACALKSGRKVVHCGSGGLRHIPVSEMDLNVHELVVTAPPDRPNNVTVGRIFLKFTALEVVRIQWSGVPAIGDSSFWPGRRLRVLDLRHNAIGFLRETDFNGLKGLRELDLSDNFISASPSAPFRHLVSLRRLALARNRLVTLVPRFFYLLLHLEELDISGNSLGQIEPENLQDVKNLKILKASACRLTELHPILYQQLPLLEELDLRDNYLTKLAPAEFRHLPHLTILRLDGNSLTSLTEGTFHGHVFRLLGLSRNNLSSLSDHAFTNSSVRHLDLSHNHLDYVLQDTTRPLAESLEVLDLDYNDLGNQAFASMVQPLRNLRLLHASNLMVKDINPDAFHQAVNLRFANLSWNALSEVPPRALLALESIEELDLSYNLLPHVSWEAMEALSNLTYFRILHLQGNPFDCGTCLIAPIFHALNESRFLDSSSSNQSDCLRCQMPPKWAGTCVDRLRKTALDCDDSIRYDRQHLVYTSQVGLIVAVTIIVVIVCIILVIIVIYRRHIAHYYTHEEEQRAWKGMYENPVMAAGCHYSDDKPTFIPTPDRVDDNIDDLRRQPASILR